MSDNESRLLMTEALRADLERGLTLIHGRPVVVEVNFFNHEAPTAALLDAAASLGWRSIEGADIPVRYSGSESTIRSVTIFGSAKATSLPAVAPTPELTTT